MLQPYIVEQTPNTGVSFDEATNRVLTGTAIAAYTTGDTVTLRAIPPPPTSEPSEVGVVQHPVTEFDTDIALVSPPVTVAVGSVFLIDAEYMIVTDVSNLDNPEVIRGALATAIEEHAPGAQVLIWGTAQPAAEVAVKNKTTSRSVLRRVAAQTQQPAPDPSKLAAPRDETKQEEIAREKLEEEDEEDKEDREDGRG